MLNYLARLGKKPYANQIVPSCIYGSTILYMIFQGYGQPIVHNLYAAESSPGKREEVSEDLQKLCLETFDELKDEYGKAILSNISQFMDIAPCPVKWFMTSSFNPIVFGFTDLKTGVLIGLPSYYNYKKAEEIPESFFRFKNFALFKNPLSSEAKKPQESGKLLEGSETTGEKTEADIITDIENQKVVKIEKQSPEGQEFIDSLVLSDKAKKYAIAKHLCIADTYDALFRSLSILLSGVFFLVASKRIVHNSTVLRAHLKRRIQLYALSTLGFVTVNYNLHQHITEQTDKVSEFRTLKLGQVYVEGSEEYKAKKAVRDKVLHRI